MFVDVILPLALPDTYTYAVPNNMQNDIEIGKRVEVQFGKSKIYSSVIARIHQNKPELFSPKNILSILDETPVVTTIQLDLWRWIASYYLCSIGEVMSAALPAAFRLQSDTFIVLAQNNIQQETLDDDEYLIVEALLHQPRLNIATIQQILQRKNIMPLIRQMLYKKIIALEEELQKTFTPKFESFIQLNEYLKIKTNVQEAFESIKKSAKQTNALMMLLHEKALENPISKKQFLAKYDFSDSILKSIQKKGFIQIFEKEISRINDENNEIQNIISLSPVQQKALADIELNFQKYNTVYLHGITGSGKTEIYCKIAESQLQQGKQVLYLLPEIFLTTQLVQRLKKVFGNKIIVYHSKFNDNERYEIWNKICNGEPCIIVGARSSVLLPFRNLSLIIIDEEHEISYKQFDPAPRYHARDVALYLADKIKSKVILGSATPSLEQYHNYTTSKIGIVKMLERYNNISPPSIEIIDIVEEKKRKNFNAFFSQKLLHESQQIIHENKQIIFFQNRRGYAPYIECADCAWVAKCKNCDISLTHHRLSNKLICHYCNYSIMPYNTCPACNSAKLQMQGAGTERIEEEIETRLENAKVARIDYDTTRSKQHSLKIMEAFQNKQFNVLIGTQMLAKGLDFESVKMVGVINADLILFYPNFRANERAFQLIYQVCGRAGRKHEQGKVFIQTQNPNHKVLQAIANNNLDLFYRHELEERKQFFYPPFSRIIRIEFKHKTQKICEEAAIFYTNLLKEKNTNCIIFGPTVGLVSRINNLFIFQILIKIIKDKNAMATIKHEILQNNIIMQKNQAFKTVQIKIDVDAYS